MFKFFKKLFVGHATEAETDDSNVLVQDPPASSAARTRQPAKPVFRPRVRGSLANGNSNGHTPTPRNGNDTAAAQTVQLKLQSVVDSLPAELKSRVRPNNVGSTEISVPLDKVLTQLALGSVKIPFGELRRLAPIAFSSQIDLDQVLVSLPLGEILGQLNPALLLRRQSQKQIVVPEEIRSPFNDAGQGLALSPAPGAAPAAAPARGVVPAPSVPAPSVPAPASYQPAPPPARTSAPIPEPAPLPPAASIPFRVSPAATPTPPAAAKAPEADRPGLISMSPVHAAPPAAPAADVVTVNLPLLLVSEGWPESLRMEIAQLNLVGVAIAIPLDTLKESMQRGKALFPWKSLRGWLKPAVPASVSAHDNTSLELPLRVVAPIFIARQRDLAKARQKVAIDENIPNLFFGFPQPETPAEVGVPPAPASCAVTKPVDTNYYAPAETAAAPAVAVAEVKTCGPTGTVFVTRSSTPNEIVTRAAALNGVSGALIALPDGLMVAGKLAPEFNGDTLAAFLPQIFGKVNQCTNELRMGELNNLNFTVGNVPWKIFRVNAIFFAAFGRAGQPMPTAALAALAAELDHKKQ